MTVDLDADRPPRRPPPPWVMVGLVAFVWFCAGAVITGARDRGLAVGVSFAAVCAFALALVSLPPRE
jgi:hypothetical protein